VAKSTPYDNGTSGLAATDVQAAIDELTNNANTTLSTGFTWGRSGNVNTNTYLINDSVPSNIAGRIVPVNTGKIVQVLVSSQNADTFTVLIQKRSGVSFINLGSFSVSASRLASFTATIPVALNDELVLKLSSGSCSNLVVALVIRSAI
jgi:hypothetical protein